MKKRYLIAVAAVVLIVAGMTIAQPKVGVPPPGPSLEYSVPVNPPQPIKPPATENKPENLTLEQLLDAVDGFRAQKAELEKKEKAYMKVVHQKAGKLKERIDGIEGVAAPVVPGIPAPGLPPAPSYPPVTPSAPMPK